MSSLLGLRGRINYEGQAAVELEAIADTRVTCGYQFEIAADGVIKTETLIRRAVDDLLNGCAAPEVSAKFHWAVIDLISSVAHSAREERHLNRVVLSGGVFQNMFLLKGACQMLRAGGFEVFSHSRVPTNDGGISLGQAAVVNARLAAGRI